MVRISKADRARAIQDFLAQGARELVFIGQRRAASGTDPRPDDTLLSLCRSHINLDAQSIDFDEPAVRHIRVAEKHLVPSPNPQSTPPWG